MDAENQGAVVFLGPGPVQGLTLVNVTSNLGRGLVLDFDSIHAHLDLSLGQDQGPEQDSITVDQDPVPQALIVYTISLEVEVITDRGPELQSRGELDPIVKELKRIHGGKGL